MTRARKIQKFLSQPFFVAEQFTGYKGKYVPIADTVRGFREIVEGKHDEHPGAGVLPGRRRSTKSWSARRRSNGDSDARSASSSSRPSAAIAHEDVDEVQLPGEEGFFGVLPGHAPLLAALAPGRDVVPQGHATSTTRSSAADSRKSLPDRVSILAPVAESAEDIDLRARRGGQTPRRRAPGEAGTGRRL